MGKTLRLALILAALAASREALASCANTVSVADSLGTAHLFCRGTDGGTNYTQQVNLLDTTGNVLGVSGNALIVNGSASTQPVSYGSGTFTTSDSHLPNSSALSDALANPTTSMLASNSLGWDATNTVWRRIQVDAGTGTLKVDASGATQPISGSVTQGSPPWAFNQTQQNGVALGSPTAYGTAPSSGNFAGVNAFVTNSPAVSQGGTWTVQEGTPPWSQNLTQVGGSAVSLGLKAMANSIPVAVASDNILQVSQLTASQLQTSASYGGGVFQTSGVGTFTTSDVHFPLAQALSDFVGNPTVTGIGAYGLAWNATNAAFQRLRADPTTGGLNVNIVGGGGTGGTASNFGSTFPAIGTAVGFKTAAGNMSYGTVDQSNNVNVNLRGVGGNQFAGPATTQASLPVTMAIDQNPITVYNASLSQWGPGPSGRGVGRVALSRDSSVTAAIDQNNNGVIFAASSNPNYGAVPSVSSLLGVSSYQAKTGAGLVYGFSVTATAAGCLYVFDAPSPPAFGAITQPLLIPPIEVAANSTVAIAQGMPPIRVNSGFALEYSSACGSSTVASATAVLGAIVN